MSDIKRDLEYLKHYDDHGHNEHDNHHHGDAHNHDHRHHGHFDEPNFYFDKKLLHHVKDLSNELHEALHSLDGIAEKTLRKAEYNSGFYSGITSQKGYSDADASNYTLITIPHKDKSGEHIEVEMHLPFGDTTNSNIVEDIFSATLFEKANVLATIPTQNTGNGHIGQWTYNYAPIVCDSLGTTYSAGITEKGALKYYLNNSEVIAAMKRDHIKQSWGIDGVLVNDGEKTTNLYPTVRTGAVGMVVYGYNFDTKTTYILIAGEADRVNNRQSPENTEMGMTYDTVADIMKTLCHRAVVMVARVAKYNANGTYIGYPTNKPTTDYPDDAIGFLYVSRKKIFKNNYTKEFTDLALKTNILSWDYHIQDEVIDGIYDHLTAIDELIIQIQEKNSEQDDRLDIAEGRLDNIDQLIIEINNHLALLDNEIDVLKDRMTSAELKISSLEVWRAAVEQWVSEVNTHFSQIDSDILELKQTVIDIQSTLVEHNNLILQVIQNISDIQTDFAELKSQFDELNFKFDELREYVTNVQIGEHVKWFETFENGLLWLNTNWHEPDSPNTCVLITYYTDDTTVPQVSEIIKAYRDVNANYDWVLDGDTKKVISAYMPITPPTSSLPKFVKSPMLSNARVSYGQAYELIRACTVEQLQAFKLPNKVYMYGEEIDCYIYPVILNTDNHDFGLVLAFHTDTDIGNNGFEFIGAVHQTTEYYGQDDLQAIIYGYKDGTGSSSKRVFSGQVSTAVGQMGIVCIGFGDTFDDWDATVQSFSMNCEISFNVVNVAYYSVQYNHDVENPTGLVFAVTNSVRMDV